MLSTNPDQVKFSICVPAYKSKFLEDCISSILDQSILDFELIILNDCSPEPVEEIVTSFNDTRIRYFKNEVNVGAEKLVDNWNKCLSLAKGEFIVIMGDDDLLETDYLKEFLKLIGNNPELGVYHCRSQIIDNEGNTKLLTPSCPAFEDVYDSIWHRLNQLRSNYISDYVYRTQSLIARNGFYNLPFAWGSDDITAFIASEPKGIAHTNKAVFKYRSHELSISSSSSNALGKLEADLGYSVWLQEFLKKKPTHLEDLTLYLHLVKNQADYMRKRKLFTMAKLMLSNPFSKLLTWIKVRKRLEISTKDILIAAVKSQILKKSNPNSI
jgi:glycosyltransferase involved in cell wall biosynthesis